MPTTSPTIAAPAAPAPILRKTRTAADFVHRHARSPLTREHAADLLRAISTWHAARPESAHAALTDLLAAITQCTGQAWLKANAADPDVTRFTDLATHPQTANIDPATWTTSWPPSCGPATPGACNFRHGKSSLVDGPADY